MAQRRRAEHRKPDRHACGHGAVDGRYRIGSAKIAPGIAHEVIAGWPVERFLVVGATWQAEMNAPRRGVQLTRSIGIRGRFKSCRSLYFPLGITPFIRSAVR